MVEYITDKQPEVRQAASYGIGVMAQFGGPVYADICPRRCRLSSGVLHKDTATQNYHVDCAEV